MTSFLVSIDDGQGSKGGGEDADETDFKVPSESSTADSLGSHVSSVGNAAGGRFGLNSMIFGCKDGWIRVLAREGAGGGESRMSGFRSGSLNDSSSYRFGALTFRRNCILDANTLVFDFQFLVLGFPVSLSLSHLIIHECVHPVIATKPEECKMICCDNVPLKVVLMPVDSHEHVQSLIWVVVEVSRNQGNRKVGTHRVQ